MRQLLGWLTILVLLGVSAGGWWLQRGRAHSAAPDAAAFTYAEHNLGQAAEKVEQMGAILGSYDGIPNDLIVGMTIAYAAGDRFCIHLLREGNWYHHAGPGGSTQRGACTY